MLTSENMEGQKISFEKADVSESEECAESEDGLMIDRKYRKRKDRCGWVVKLFSHLTALFVGFLLCLLAISWQDEKLQQTCTDSKLRRSSLVPEDLTRYSVTMRYNGTLDFPSIYRGNGEMTNQAWEDLSKVGFMDLDVTDEDIEELGVDPETLARFPEEDGGGYVLTIEYTHQLHCLDLLRSVNPWNYAAYQAREQAMQDAERTPEMEMRAHEMFKTHVDHCTEMLRQILMCHADTTPIFQQWVSVRSHPWPNFNTVHQCRDFHAIQQWTKAHFKSSDTAWPHRPKQAKALIKPP